MKKKFLELMKRLGFSDRADKLKDEELATLDTEVKKEFDGKNLSEVLALCRAEDEQAKQLKEIGSIVKSATSAKSDTPDSNENGDGGQENPNKDGAGAEETAAADGKVDLAELQKNILSLVKENKTLRKNPENSGPKDTVTAKKEQVVMLCGPGTTDDYLFGIEHDMFARDHFWNDHAVTGILPRRNYTSSQQDTFFAAFDGYAVAVSERAGDLIKTGQMQTMLAGNLDYSDLESELGDYYRVRRMDAIITHLMKLDSVSSIFPIRYNVQDEEVIVNMFEGKSYSQAFQSGRVFGGSFKFQPQKAKVKDVMFKMKFSNLKDLEKQYIGYKNLEGSDPIKWNMIEWIMVKCGIIQHNERELRRVKGVRVEPTPEKAAHFLYGSNGVLTTLDNLVEKDVRVYMFNDYKAYTPSTILDYTTALTRAFTRMVGVARAKDYVLCMNAEDIPDYRAAHREKYGTDNDYNGSKLEVKDFKIKKIVGIVNMPANRKDMFFMPEGAIEIHEDLPGEFFAYHFQRDFEELYVMSYAKEGTFGHAGRKYASQAALIESKGKQTLIFRNNPVDVLADGETTADAFENEMFETSANAGATAFTDFENASEGCCYKLRCGSTTNATTIAKAGKFSEITAAWNPTAVGDYIKVIYDPTDDKFIELERKVGGVVSENEDARSPECVE